MNQSSQATMKKNVLQYCTVGSPPDRRDALLQYDTVTIGLIAQNDPGSELLTNTYRTTVYWDPSDQSRPLLYSLSLQIVQLLKATTNQQNSHNNTTTQPKRQRQLTFDHCAAQQRWSAPQKPTT